MTINGEEPLRDYCFEVAQRAHRAAAELALVTGEQKNDWLRRSARLLRDRSVALTESNRVDLAQPVKPSPSGWVTSRLPERNVIERCDFRAPHRVGRSKS